MGSIGSKVSICALVAAGAIVATFIDLGVNSPDEMSASAAQSGSQVVHVGFATVATGIRKLSHGQLGPVLNDTIALGVITLFAVAVGLVTNEKPTLSTILTGVGVYSFMALPQGQGRQVSPNLPPA